jgi:hypothetical protein
MALSVLATRHENGVAVGEQLKNKTNKKEQYGNCSVLFFLSLF